MYGYKITWIVFDFIFRCCYFTSEKVRPDVCDVLFIAGLIMFPEG